jgi:alkanesulfonate monooxygenase SsuD/methylene tetrahydromethanopterin reductase-like flavin-dependent oxidoreductase (luciferase family)
MRIGVGLPSTLPGADGALILEWARRADAGPFASLAVLDRAVYDSFDPFVALAAVAAVAPRLRLATTIAIGPLRRTALLAKAAAALDTLSGGRLVLGLAVGARREDYAAVGADYVGRGRRLVEQLRTLRATWEDWQAEPERAAGPASTRRGGPALLVGGLSDQTFARVARYADGYVHGGGPPRAFARAADRVRAAWGDAGRPGYPQLWAQGYFVLGDDATIAAGRQYLRHYYAFAGPFAERIAAELLTTPQAIAGFLRGYAGAGCDEMVLFPTVPDLAQLDRLAEVLARLGDRYDPYSPLPASTGEEARR